MIVLITDRRPVSRQVRRVLYNAPAVPVIDLFSNAPMWNPKATSYLIAAYRQGFPDGSVFFCVVDPDVGSGKRTPVVVQCDGHHFVGPDNGQFEITAMRA
ncbi:MAG: SAM-dependent chlorinase/fluorinase [Gammaproteobacteria bacterium]